MPSQTSQWYVVSSHGAVLFYIAVHPDCTIRQIADGMTLTQRTVWGLIGDLRSADMLDVRREGRKHHYTVSLDQKSKFTNPTMNFPMKAVLGPIVEQALRLHHQSGK